MRPYIKRIVISISLGLIAGPLLAGQLSADQVMLEANILHRDSDKNTVYLYNNNGTVNNAADDIALAGTGGFSSDADTGYRLSGSKRLSASWSINAVLSSSELSKTDTFIDPSSHLEIFRSPLTANFDAANYVSAAYYSRLRTAEVNAIYRLGGSMDLLAGITRLKLDEQFKIVSDDNLAAGIGTYTINTDNKMLGPQIGLAYSYKPGARYRIYFIGKLAWLSNDASQNQYVDDAPTFTRNNSASVSHSSTMYDFKVGINYYFTDQLAANLGYQYIKITEVALAESQFDTTAAGPATLTASDSVSWGGFSLGLGYYF